MAVPRAPFFLLVVAALLPACRKPVVESYRVPKEKAVAASADPTAPAGSVANAPANAPAAPAMGAAGGMANTAVPTASGAGLTWTPPAHWTSKSGSAMRKATFGVKGAGGAEAELSITAFPGDVGGDLANLNRWRGQVELPPITQAQLEKETQHVDHNGLHMTVADIGGTGANAKRILGAMIPFEGATWFVKLIGPDAVVAQERAAFTAFLDSIKPASTAK